MRTKLLGSLGVAAVAAVVIACTPPPEPTKPPAPPRIDIFEPAASTAVSPALTTFKWKVSDPNKDDLTCVLEIDGDVATTITIRSCQGTGSRNIPLAVLNDVTTTHTATLTVTDGVEVDGVVGTSTKSASVILTVGPTEPFDITLIGVDQLDPESAAAFESASTRWSQAIVRGLPDVDGSVLGTCGVPEGEEPPTAVDDVVIYTKVAPIDGPGTILGQAGPTCTMSGNQLTVVGEMTFDSDDVATMKANNTLIPVILHEMGHVLGIGTLWDTTGWPSGTRTLLTGAGTTNPRFMGVAASAEYELLNNRSDMTGVPVESGGSSGTADSHWRESVFTSELMTGWIGGVAPMSAMSIASLADLGYKVDLSVADQFKLGYDVTASGFGSSTVGLQMLRPPVEVA